MQKTLIWPVIILLSLALYAAPAMDKAQQDKTMQKISQLYKAGEFQKALAITDKALAEDGDSQPFLEARYYLLLQLKRNAEALETALKREETGPKTNPWICLDIAGLSLQQGDQAKALEWLEKAVERGFTGLSAFMDEVYSPLHDQPRFKALIRKVKQNIGIDKPARDFSVSLLGGNKFSLSDQKGKVILIDFWASWCGPCRREMPDLKKLYAEFKTRNFEIIGISLDRSRESLDEYLKENPLDWPIAFSGAAWTDATAALYGVRSIPSLWLVDRKGILRHFDLRGETLHKAIAELIEEI